MIQNIKSGWIKFLVVYHITNNALWYYQATIDKGFVTRIEYVEIFKDIVTTKCPLTDAYKVMVCRLFTTCNKKSTYGQRNLANMLV